MNSKGADEGVRVVQVPVVTEHTLNKFVAKVKLGEQVSYYEGLFP